MYEVKESTSNYLNCIYILSNLVTSTFSFYENSSIPCDISNLGHLCYL